MLTKVCSNKNCIHNGSEQQISNFNKRKAMKDGYRSQCKDCDRMYEKERNKENKTKIFSTFEKICSNTTCSLSGIIQPIVNFYQDIHKEDGYDSQCKLCISEYRKNIYNKETKKKTSKDFVKYTTVSDQLKQFEEIRIDPISSKWIQVKCKYCGEFFTPTRSQIYARLSALNGTLEKNKHSDYYFYCSEGCKKACPLFNRWVNYKGFAPATSREVQSELRKLVLERDNYSCKKCNISMSELRLADKTLHCHHILPINESPIESADVSNCISVCEDCHKELHQIDGCKLG